MLRRTFESEDFSSPERLAKYVSKTTTYLLTTIENLKNEYNDGRFLQTIEDLVFSILLKSGDEIKFDYVVGNPPYVRIQNIPNLQRDYWAGRYEWV